MTTKFYGLLCVLLTTSLTVVAEGNCPSGYYPIGGDAAGWHGCAPMDGGVSNEPAEETMPKEAQEEWEDRWGAIATANGAFGVSVSKRSKEPAAQEALAECRRNAGKEVCKLKPPYYNQCAALAWGDTTNIVARGPEIYEVEKRAVDLCSKETRNCRIYYSACSLPVRVRQKLKMLDFLLNQPARENNTSVNRMDSGSQKVRGDLFEKWLNIEASSATYK